MKEPSTDVQFISDNDRAARRVVSLPQAGTYVFELNVNDGKSTSTPDTVTITTNFRPVANAGDDQGDDPKVFSSTFSEKIIELDGSRSSDMDDNDSLTYEWSIDSAPTASGLSNATLKDSKTAFPRLTIPETIPGESKYIMKLIVMDKKRAKSEPDFVVVTVTGISG